MKIFIANLVLVSVILPSMAVAKGEHYNGYVSIMQDGYAIRLTATYNARYSQYDYGPNREYVQINRYNNYSINVFAVAEYGDPFWCYISPGSKGYDALEDMMVAGGDGTFFEVVRGMDDPECSFVNHAQGSQFSH